MLRLVLVKFDVLTICVLTGVVYGPIGAWNAAGSPARPWAELSRSAQILGVVALCGAVIAVIVIAAIGRPFLALLLAGSGVLSYLAARHRRSR